jgi:hypothetical protein
MRDVPGARADHHSVVPVKVTDEAVPKQCVTKTVTITSK